MVVFDLVKPMVVMEFLSHALSNACNAGLMSVQSYGGRVNTDVNRSNIQRCITWTKKHKIGEII